MISKLARLLPQKSLGVAIDDKLDWSGHTEKVRENLASGIRAIKRIRQLVPKATLHLIYQALIQPHFYYCKTVWGKCGITLRNKVQKLQNTAARVLTSSNYYVDAGHLFKLLRWKNPACQQKIQRGRLFTGLCMGSPQTILVLNLKGVKSHITLRTLRINSKFHFRAQTITKIDQ